MSRLRFEQLGNLCTFTRGLTYKKGDEVPFSKSIVLRANNIDLATGKIVFDDLRYINDEVVIPASKYVKKGNIIICTASGSKTHLGKNAYIEKDYGYAFGGFMGQLEPNCEIEGKYLYWFLQSPFYVDWIGNLSDGVNINNLKFDQISQIEIPIIPRTNQLRIVAILDDAFERIDKAIANTVKNIANVSELVDSYIESSFEKYKNTDTTTIKSCVDIVVGFAFKSSEYSTDKDGIRLIRGDNIVQGEFRWNDVKKIKKSDSSKYLKFALKIDDIVIAMDRTFVKSGMKYAVVTEGDIPSFLVQRVACLRAKKQLNNNFLECLISSPMFARYILSIQTGLGVPHISAGQINAFEFPCIEYKEQVAIAEKIIKVQKDAKNILSIYQYKIKALSALKQSLLAAAFSGELTADFNPDALEL